ncbi:MAG: adenosine deaminase [Acidobacteriales bacterium]|nr:MAG: adenosine deaminase [Terriglobales bacterium]
MGVLYHQLPKAELHLHLEGAIEPETLHELAPDLSPAEIEEHYRYDDFQGFLKNYEWVARRLNTPEDFALITRRLLERLARENVRYAEIILSAGVILWRNQDLGPIYEAVRRESASSPVEVWWIFDGVRQFGVENVQSVAQLAAERRHDGVIGLGIGGDEARGPAQLFKDVYRYAAGTGLRLTAHAGETGGPESVWAALELGAERIGHGIRSIEDPVLLRHLRDHDIPLEISISSNVATGAVASLENHPVRRLYDAGVPIVLNTDDPAMFHTTLTREYELAVRVFGFTEAQLRGIAENGFRYAFCRTR